MDMNREDHLEEIEFLRSELKSCKDVEERVRLNCILLYLERGKTYDEIAYCVYVSSKTVERYIRDYKNDQKRKSKDRGGSKSYLSPEQSQSLKDHLKQYTYLKTREIIDYVKKIHGVEYTLSGMKSWLHQAGFVYKRPTTLPGRVCVEKQKAFIETYEKLKNGCDKNDVIVFIDAVHPEHQSQRICGWIQKGQVKHLPTTAKQTRLHFMGGLSLGENGDFHDICVKEYKTIKAEQGIDFFNDLQEKYKDKSNIYLICDNARSFKCKAINTYLENNKRVKIIYLPPYSPNLNPIERLWKIMRQNVHYNTYHEKFIDFCQSTRSFFDEKIPLMKEKIKGRINDKFQILSPNLLEKPT